MNDLMHVMLDFDGVLHRDAVWHVNGRIELRAEGVLFEWAPHLIEALKPYPEARIVLSTSWARHLGYTRAREHLPKALRDRVVGATWHSAMAINPDGPQKLYPTWWDQVYRFEQIERYVKRARLTRWVAIDDDGAGWPEAKREHLVLTDSEKGLSDSAALKCLRALLKQHSS